MMIWLCLVLLAADDKAADAALETFRAAVKGKDAAGRAEAVAALSLTQHEKVTAKLVGLLGTEAKEVRIAAARGLGGRSEEKDRLKAAAALGEALPGNEPEVQIALLKSIGELKLPAPLPRVHKLFEAEPTAVAKAAIEAAGEIRSRDSIGPLIELAGDVWDAAGGGGGRLPGVVRGRLARSGTRDAKKEVLQLGPPLRRALKSLTGEDFKSADDAEAWWKANQATFRVQPRD
jgi:hypothetical protein